ncbi:rhombosortase [Glaciecola sp. SC05]|uniref:rhombosortase n=1 Tax=Glaciecola sp. SC05 TaxID=1987355 RepID=UPI0035277D59
MTHYKSWAACLVITVLCSAAMLLPSNITDAMVLSEAGLANGELWRMFTAHFVHTNLWHFALNIAGLWLTWLLFVEYFSPQRLLLALAFSTLGLSMVLFATNNLQSITWYAGLSGTLHGLFAFALVLDVNKKRVTTYIIIIFGIGKLIFEQMGGSTQSTAELIGASVAINGHLWGAVLGVVAGCIVKVLELQQQFRD